jgi:hypothetical protein
MEYIIWGIVIIASIYIYNLDNSFRRLSTVGSEIMSESFLLNNKTISIVGIIVVGYYLVRRYKIYKEPDYTDQFN